ncbi:MAG: hypothetical protein KJ727_03020 [Acidobacteria bacterium]|nr:hypothetical protein [Acidobacteriota bacterium]MBU4253556.1 hypothetical protein [Acidobacteriota bacterium]MBU4328925.1 hypothetical protein [Acidobacteriota bacterium]MBU4494009.1 hypothetical protein [Acidobacteriota bacterium]MCG2814663.1 hypothetical protein [Candidatus Aminicenantes bacterium]
MKKSSALLLLVSLAFFSCTSMESYKMRLEIPGETSVDIGKYTTVYLPDFLIIKAVEEFDINHELLDYFTFEIEKKIKKTVSTDFKAPEKEDRFKEPEFWKRGLKDDAPGLILTGSVEYVSEVRKALIGTDKQRFEDPFPSESRLSERRFYILNIHLYLIDGETGQPIYDRKFKETKTDKNPNQTAYFAFFELIQRVRDKLFLEIKGGDRVQQRYLIK